MERLLLIATLKQLFESLDFRFEFLLFNYFDLNTAEVSNCIGHPGVNVPLPNLVDRVAY
jgi:hypothetical protein